MLTVARTQAHFFRRKERLLRMLTYSVSRYWCNGIRGFHMKQRRCFWWVFVPKVDSGGAHYFTSLSVLNLFRTTIIYICTSTILFLCVLHLEYPLWTAQDEGHRTQRLFHSFRLYFSDYISSLVPDLLRPQQTTQKMSEIFSENHEETFVFWKKCNVSRNDAKIIWTLSQTTRKTERKARFNLVRSTYNAIQPNTTTV